MCRDDNNNNNDGRYQSSLRSPARHDPPNDPEGDLTGTFEVFHECPLKFEGHLLSCAQIPAAKESDPD
jgi:hypothetical protein